MFNFLFGRKSEHRLGLKIDGVDSVARFKLMMERTGAKDEAELFGFCFGLAEAIIERAELGTEFILRSPDGAEQRLRRYEAMREALGAADRCLAKLHGESLLTDAERGKVGRVQVQVAAALANAAKPLEGEVPR